MVCNGSGSRRRGVHHSALDLPGLDDGKGDRLLDQKRKSFASRQGLVIGVSVRRNRYVERVNRCALDEVTVIGVDPAPGVPARHLVAPFQGEIPDCSDLDTLHQAEVAEMNFRDAAKSQNRDDDASGHVYAPSPHGRDMGTDHDGASIGRSGDDIEVSTTADMCPGNARRPDEGATCHHAADHVVIRIHLPIYSMHASQCRTDG